MSAWMIASLPVWLACFATFTLSMAGMVCVVFEWHELNNKAAASSFAGAIMILVASGLLGLVAAWMGGL